MKKLIGRVIFEEGFGNDTVEKIHDLHMQIRKLAADGLNVPIEEIESRIEVKHLKTSVSLDEEFGISK